jgi:hypothetical protein
MLHLVQTTRSYSSETLAVMGAAFDRACQSMSKETNVNDAVKKTLALIILRHVDQGEFDEEQLVDIAIREWAGAQRAPVARRRATG